MLYQTATKNYTAVQRYSLIMIYGTGESELEEWFARVLFATSKNWYGCWT